MVKPVRAALSVSYLFTNISIDGNLIIEYLQTSVQCNFSIKITVYELII